MKILLPTFGSAGDVHPVVGLGLALKQRGHEVTIITNPYFQSLIERAGLTFIGLGTVEDYQAFVENPHLWHPKKGFELIARQGILRALRPIYELIACYDPAETLIAASGLIFGARIAQEKLGFRLATVHLQPALLWSIYKSPVMAGLPLPDKLPPFIKKLIFKAIDALVSKHILAPETNAFRAELGLPPAWRFFGHWLHSPQKVMGLFPDWFAPPQPDWPANTELTGFIQYDGATEQVGLAPEIARFLDKGEPPLIFTLGTAMQHGQHFFAASVEAAQSLGKRALLLTRHLAHLPTNLPAPIRHVDYIPFSQVLPRAAVLIHHGGIGTLAQALAAGIPQLVMPMSHDQPDNARRLERLGVSLSLTPAHYQAKKVASKLDQLLRSPQVRSQCQAMAQKVNFNEALTKSCLAIEGLVELEPRRSL